MEFIEKVPTLNKSRRFARNLQMCKHHISKSLLLALVYLEYTFESLLDHPGL